MSIDVWAAVSLVASDCWEKARKRVEAIERMRQSCEHVCELRCPQGHHLKHIQLWGGGPGWERACARRRGARSYGGGWWRLQIELRMGYWDVRRLCTTYHNYDVGSTCAYE